MLTWEHYANAIDFQNAPGQFKNNKEIKLNYRITPEREYEFVFMDSFLEMITQFNERGIDVKIPYDWTIYYLRQKALEQKVSKEELAWIILNYNQKRGYYQLRGEENENDNTKTEEYFQLKVKSVEEKGDSNSKGTWYNVILENDWVYRRQSNIPLTDWIGTTKEFIVTTQLEKDGTERKDKDGNIKRSFRSVDSEKDWIAIKQKTEKDIERTGKSVAQYIYQSLLDDPTQKIHGKLIKTIERKYYQEELNAILNEQKKYHPELSDKKMYQQCVNELYPKNLAHQANLKDKDCIHLILDDTIFFQRPLKSKKSTIADCQYEKRYYVTDKGERKEIPLKGVSKSHPLFQEFRLWQFLRNLKIYQKEKTVNGKTEIDIDVTNHILQNTEDWLVLFEFLNSKKEIDI